MTASTQSPTEKTPLPPRGPRTWVMVLVGAIIVASGVVIGAGATVLILKNCLVTAPAAGAPAAAAIADDLRSRYDLTAEQAARVRQIMAERMEAIEAIRSAAHEKMRAEHEKLRAEMKTVLTPEQYARWSEHFDAVRPAPFGPPKGGPGVGPGGGRPGQGRPMFGEMPPGGGQPGQPGNPPQGPRGGQQQGPRGPGRTILPGGQNMPAQPPPPGSPDRPDAPPPP